MLHIRSEYGARLINVTISYNNASQFPGLFSINSLLTVQSSTIQNNSATADPVRLENLEYKTNAACYVSGGSLALLDSLVSDNWAESFAGALLLAQSDCRISNSQFRGNAAVAGSGGAVHAEEAKLHLDNTTLQENFAGHDGGGLFMRSSSLILANATQIVLNQARQSGGGLVFYQSHVSDVEFSVNISLNAAGVGGGLRYLKSTFSPEIFGRLAEAGIVRDNSARFFGDNVCSIPKYLRILNEE